jgi:hypothetical protein
LGGQTGGELKKITIDPYFLTLFLDEVFSKSGNTEEEGGKKDSSGKGEVKETSSK